MPLASSTRLRSFSGFLPPPFQSRRAASGHALGGNPRPSSGFPQPHSQNSMAQTPVAGIPVRFTGRGAVNSFQDDSALLTGPLASRWMNSPWPSCARISPSWTATWASRQGKARQAFHLLSLEYVVIDGGLLIGSFNRLRLLRIPDHDVGIGADKDGAFPRVAIQDFGDVCRGHGHKFVRRKPSGIHALGPEHWHSVPPSRRFRSGFS